MKYIHRTISNKTLELANQFPVVTITGPRQSGKTTLCRTLFPQKRYFNLEDPVTRAFAKEDPRGFFNGIGENGVIIDEIQRVPELTSYIQPIVDQNPQKGRFILTGSHQFELMSSVSQSLAGRSGLLKLLPLSLEELSAESAVSSPDTYLYNGFYPRIYQDNLNPTDYYGIYLETYIERDLRQAINISNLSAFERFLRLLAGRVGSLVNINSLTNDTGVTGTTLKNWLSVLEASYIIYLLQPYHSNISKRLIKSPKIFFYDVGLAAYLNGIELQSQLVNYPLRGSLFENLVITEFLKTRFNNGRKSNLYFYRDTKDNEVDLICDSPDIISAIEIKSSQTPSTEFTKGINSFKDAIKTNNVNGYVYYAGNESLVYKDVKYTPWGEYSRREID
ncbi:MAG: ATP-binding protein [Fibrobacter sp.]|nr:ATP-binding protein [Fibrobacter sp.]